MDNGNGPPARIEISQNKDGKLLSQLEWPKIKAFRGNSLRHSWKSYCTLHKKKNSQILLFTVPNQSSREAKIMRLESVRRTTVFVHT